MTKTILEILTAQSRDYRQANGYDPCKCGGQLVDCLDCDGTGFLLPEPDDDQDYDVDPTYEGDAYFR